MYGGKEGKDSKSNQKNIGPKSKKEIFYVNKEVGNIRYYRLGLQKHAGSGESYGLWGGAGEKKPQQVRLF